MFSLKCRGFKFISADQCCFFETSYPALVNKLYRGYYTGARRYEFYFRVAKQYFTNERSEWVKYCFCHEKIKFISSSRRVMFFLLYRHADDGVFDDFPKISDHLPKISEDFPKLFRRPDERSRTFFENFRKFPKMPEDCRRLPKTFEEDPKMFRWYTNEFKYNLRDKLDINEIIDKLTCEIMENKPLGSRM